MNEERWEKSRISPASAILSCEEHGMAAERNGQREREREKGMTRDEKHFFLRSWPSKTFMSDVSWREGACGGKKKNPSVTLIVGGKKVPVWGLKWIQIWRMGAWILEVLNGLSQVVCPDRDAREQRTSTAERWRQFNVFILLLYLSSKPKYLHCSFNLMKFSPFFNTFMRCFFIDRQTQLHFPAQHPI